MGGFQTQRSLFRILEEIIKDIDNDILEDHHNQHPVVTEIIQNLARRDEDTTKVGQYTDSQALIKGDSMIGDRGELEKVLARECFQVGWVKDKSGTKGAKARKKKRPKKRTRPK